jgi:hypothetical protein
MEKIRFLRCFFLIPLFSLYLIGCNSGNLVKELNVEKLPAHQGCKITIPPKTSVTIHSRFKYKKGKISIIEDGRDTVNWVSSETGMQAPVRTYTNNLRNISKILLLKPAIQKNGFWTELRFMAIDTVLPGFKVIRFRDVPENYPPQKEIHLAEIIVSIQAAD